MENLIEKEEKVEISVVACEDDESGRSSYRLKYVRYFWIQSDEDLAEYQELIDTFLERKFKRPESLSSSLVAGLDAGDGFPTQDARSNEGLDSPEKTPQKDQDGRFYCPLCPKSFKHRYDYIMHQKTHSGTNPYFCKTCDIYFPRKSKLTKHLKTKSHQRKCSNQTMDSTEESCLDDTTDEPPAKRNRQDFEQSVDENRQPFECQHCCQRFPSEEEKSSHQCCLLRDKKPKIQPKEYLKSRAHYKKFVCPLCDVEYFSYVELNQHLTTEHTVTEETTFPCKTCDVTYQSKDKWVQHLNDTKHMSLLQPYFRATCCEKTFKTHKACYNHERVHTRSSPYHCTRCDRYFLKRHHLTVHLEGCVDSERPYQCPFCVRTYKTSSQLQHHLEGGHSFQCATCLENFTCKPHLKTHLEESPTCIKNICSRCNNLEFETYEQLLKHKEESHSTKGRKTFSCSDCGKTYCEAFKLKQHMTWHETGRYPYQCTVEGCTIICYKKSKLDSHHKRVHLKLMEYECSACGEEFKTKKNLDEHSSKIHGTESFTCPVCDKEFYSLRTFKAHELTHSKLPTQTHLNNTSAINNSRNTTNGDDVLLDLRCLTNLSMALDGSDSMRESRGDVDAEQKMDLKIPAIMKSEHLTNFSTEDAEEVAGTEIEGVEIEAENEMAVDDIPPPTAQSPPIVTEGGEEIVIVEGERAKESLRQLLAQQQVTIKIASSEDHHNEGDGPHTTVTSETMQQLKSTLSDLLSATLGGQSSSETATSTTGGLEIQGQPHPDDDGVVEIVLMPTSSDQASDNADPSASEE